MPSPRRINPRLIKRNRTYSATQLVKLLGVHKNTVRNWQRDGLAPIDDGRPVLFHGEALRTYLVNKASTRKRPCPLGTLFCFRCREPRKPALAMVEYVERTVGAGNLRALCEACETTMHRRVRREALGVVMSGIEVQILEASSRLNGTAAPSLSCDLEGDTSDGQDQRRK